MNENKSLLLYSPGIMYCVPNMRQWLRPLTLENYKLKQQWPKSRVLTISNDRKDEQQEEI